MKFLIAIFLVCTCTIRLVELKCVKKTSINVKTYKINLDLPAAERFVETSADFKQEIKALVDAQK